MFVMIFWSIPISSLTFFLFVCLGYSCCGTVRVIQRRLCSLCATTRRSSTSRSYRSVPLHTANTSHSSLENHDPNFQGKSIRFHSDVSNHRLYLSLQIFSCSPSEIKCQLHHYSLFFPKQIKRVDFSTRFSFLSGWHLFMFIWIQCKEMKCLKGQLPPNSNRCTYTDK